MSFKIVVTTFNGGPVLQECLDSLQGYDVEVIDTRERGWHLADAWNHAVQKYCIEEKYEAVIITNDDVVFEGDTCDLLVGALIQKQFEEPLAREALVVKAFDKTCRRYYSPQDLVPGWRDWLNEGWFCFATTRKLFDVCGPFDNTWPAYFEDGDMALRIYEKGYGTISYAGVWHKGASTTFNDPARAVYIEKLKPLIREYYKKKHGEYPTEGPKYEAAVGAMGRTPW